MRSQSDLSFTLFALLAAMLVAAALTDNTASSPVAVAR